MECNYAIKDNNILPNKHINAPCLGKCWSKVPNNECLQQSSSITFIYLCRSYTACRENEKCQDQLLDCKLGRGKVLSEKEQIKLQGKRKKSESAVRKCDMEYYAAAIKSERSRYVITWDTYNTPYYYMQFWENIDFKSVRYKSKSFTPIWFLLPKILSFDKLCSFYLY